MIFIKFDIVFILDYLVRYMSDFVIYYGHAFKKLMRYLKLIVNQKLCFGLRRNNSHFVVYINAN